MEIFDFTPVFAKWMSSMDYRDSYFEEPDDLSMKLQIEFVRYAAEELRKILNAADVTETPLSALMAWQVYSVSLKFHWCSRK